MTLVKNFLALYNVLKKKTNAINKGFNKKGFIVNSK